MSRLSSHRLLTPIAAESARPTVAAVLGALVGVFFIAFLGLREFGFSDYEVEAKPAIDQLIAGDVSGFFSQLPGYGGAVILQAPFGLLGNLFGTDHDLWAWRFQAVPGMLALFLLATLLGRRVAMSLGGLRGLGWGAFTALLVAGAPLALLAQQTGHPEELLVGGLAVGAVLLASRGNLVLAGAVVGVAAVAKPWAVIVVPVVLLAAADRRSLIRAVIACVVAGALLATPSFVFGGTDKVAASTHVSTTGIFKPANVFWFAGRTNPDWGKSATHLFEDEPAKAGWAQRLEPPWAARVSHPLIVVVSFALALGYWRRRSRAREDLLLLMAGVCWWRCLLDTWNVHYYGLVALLALAAWEAHRGRPPVVAAVATSAAWVTSQFFPWSAITPDQHTALYLTWAVPLGVCIVWRLLAPESFGRAYARIARPASAQLPSLARLVSPAARVSLSLPAPSGRVSARATTEPALWLGVERTSPTRGEQRETDRPWAATVNGRVDRSA